MFKKLKLKKIVSLLLIATFIISSFSAFLQPKVEVKAAGLDSNAIRSLYISLAQKGTETDISDASGSGEIDVNALRALAVYMSNYYIPYYTAFNDADSNDKISTSDHVAYKAQMKEILTEGNGICLDEDVAEKVITAITENTRKSISKLYVDKNQYYNLLSYVYGNEHAAVYSDSSNSDSYIADSPIQVRVRLYKDAEGKDESAETQGNPAAWKFTSSLDLANKLYEKRNSTYNFFTIENLNSSTDANANSYVSYFCGYTLDNVSGNGELVFGSGNNKYSHATVWDNYFKGKYSDTEEVTVNVKSKINKVETIKPGDISNIHRIATYVDSEAISGAGDAANSLADSKADDLIPGTDKIGLTMFHGITTEQNQLSDEDLKEKAAKGTFGFLDSTTGDNEYVQTANESILNKDSDTRSAFIMPGNSDKQTWKKVKYLTPTFYEQAIKCGFWETAPSNSNYIAVSQNMFVDLMLYDYKIKTDKTGKTGTEVYYAPVDIPICYDTGSSLVEVFSSSKECQAAYMTWCADLNYKQGYGAAITSLSKADIKQAETHTGFTNFANGMYWFNTMYVDWVGNIILNNGVDIVCVVPSCANPYTFGTMSASTERDFGSTNNAVEIQAISAISNQDSSNFDAVSTDETDEDAESNTTVGEFAANSDLFFYDEGNENLSDYQHKYKYGVRLNQLPGADTGKDIFTIFEPDILRAYINCSPDEKTLTDDDKTGNFSNMLNGWFNEKNLQVFFKNLEDYVGLGSTTKRVKSTLNSTASKSSSDGSKSKDSKKEDTSTNNSTDSTNKNESTTETKKPESATKLEDALSSPATQNISLTTSKIDVKENEVTVVGDGEAASSVFAESLFNVNNSGGNQSKAMASFQTPFVATEGIGANYNTSKKLRRGYNDYRIGVYVAGGDKNDKKLGGTNHKYCLYKQYGSEGAPIYQTGVVLADADTIANYEEFTVVDLASTDGEALRSDTEIKSMSEIYQNFDIDEQNKEAVTDTWNQITSDTIKKSIFYTYMLAYTNYMTKSLSFDPSYNLVDMKFNGDGFPAVGNSFVELELADEMPQQVLSMAFNFLHPKQGVMYVATWFRSKVSGIILSTVESMVGGTNSNYTTGMTKYLPKQGYLSIPNLRDIEWIDSLLDNYSNIVVFLAILISILLLLSVIVNKLSLQRAVFGFLVFSILIYLPPTMLNAVADLSNKANDRIYTDKFEYWALTQLEVYEDTVTKREDKAELSDNTKASLTDEAELKQLLGEDSSTVKDSQVDEVKEGFGGVRLKWMAPKRFQTARGVLKAINKTSLTQSSAITNMMFTTVSNAETGKVQVFDRDSDNPLYVYRDNLDIYRYCAVGYNIYNDYKLKTNSETYDLYNQHRFYKINGKNNSPLLNNWAGGNGNDNMAQYSIKEAASKGKFSLEGLKDSNGKTMREKLSYNTQKTPDSTGYYGGRTVIQNAQRLTGGEDNAYVQTSSINAVKRGFLYNTIDFKDNSAYNYYKRQSTNALSLFMNYNETIAKVMTNYGRLNQRKITGSDVTLTSIDDLNNAIYGLPLSSYQYTADALINNSVYGLRGVNAEVKETGDIVNKLDFNNEEVLKAFNDRKSNFLTAVNTVLAEYKSEANYADLERKVYSVMSKFITNNATAKATKKTLNSIVKNKDLRSKLKKLIDDADSTEATTSKDKDKDKKTSSIMDMSVVNAASVTDEAAATPNTATTDDSTSSTSISTADNSTTTDGTDTTEKEKQGLVIEEEGFEDIKAREFARLSDFYYGLYTESPLYYFNFNLRDQAGAKSGYTFNAGNNSTINSGNTGAFRKLVLNNNQEYFYNMSEDAGSGYGELRDFMNMHDLFTYVIPTLQQSVNLTHLFDDIYGLETYDDCSLVVYSSDAAFKYDGIMYEDDGAYGFNNGFASKWGSMSDSEKYKFWHDYNVNAILKSYCAWVDTMNDCQYAKPENIRVAGETYTVEKPLDPSSYFKVDNQGKISEGRYMIFSRSEMKYYGLTEADLTEVEKKIIAVQDEVYNKSIKLMNYYTLSDEALMYTLSMEELFAFNNTFSQNSLTGNSYNLYPNGYELKSMSNDAYLRLAVAESSGESIADSDADLTKTLGSKELEGKSRSIYARVQENTSIFFGLTLLINAFIMTYVIPMIRFIFLFLMFGMIFILIMSAVVGSELNLSKIIIDSLVKPFIIFLGVSVAFSYVISLFLSNGNTNVVNIRKPTISLGDPTLGLVVMCVANATFTVLYWKMLSKCWQDVKLHTMEVLTSVQETISGLGKSMREMGSRFMSKTRVGNTVNNIAGNRSAGGSEVSTSAVQRSKANKVTNVDSKSRKVQSTDSQFSSKSTKESKAKEEREKKKLGVKGYEESMQNTQKRTSSVQSEVAERNASKRVNTTISSSSSSSSNNTTVNNSRIATVNRTNNQATSSTNSRVETTSSSYNNIGEKYRNKDVPKTNNGDTKAKAMADRLKKS